MSKSKKISEKIKVAINDNPKIEDDLKWINIVDAGKDEIEYLRKNFNFELMHLHSSLARTEAQRPIITNGKNYIFMVMHFPVFKNGTVVPAEIDFFIGKKYLVTLHDGNVGPLNDFYNLYKKDGSSFQSYQDESAILLLYELLHKIILSIYSSLDKLSLSIKKVEILIFEHEQKKAVTEILSLRRNIVSLRRILHSHKDIMKKFLKHKNDIDKDVDVAKQYKHLIEHIKTIWENLENYKEIVEILNNTNESLYNDQMNNIMKTLTIFSVIVFPLTLLAAIFGMNTTNGMPFMNTPYAFWIIIAIMFTGSLCMLLIFEKKKWL